MAKDRLEIDSNGKVVDKSSKGFYGVFSIVLLIGAVVLFKLAIDIVIKSLSCIFSPGSNAGNSVHTGYILAMLAVIVLIIAIATAGASLATGSQSILGALTIGLVLLPFVWIVASNLLGIEMDWSALGSTQPASGPGSVSPAVRCSM
jgi:hypothetical protein